MLFEFNFKISMSVSMSKFL